MTNTSNVKIYKFVICVLVIVSIIVFTLPHYSFAVTDQGFADMTDLFPVSNVLFSNVTTGIVSNPGNAIIYGCCASVPNYPDSLNSGVLFVSTDPQAQLAEVKNTNGNDNHWFTWTYNGVNLYINRGPWNKNQNNNYPLALINVGTQAPANQLCIDFFDYVISGGSGGSGSNSSTVNYSLPAGNIAIIETDSSYGYINLMTTMPLQSTSFSGNPWPNTTQRIGFFNTLPQNINPSSMGNTIEWERHGNTTLFNITTSAKYNPSVVSKFKYVVISNPYYYPANDMEDHQATNGAINISMDGVVNIIVKNLTATVNTQTGAVENNYNGEEWTGEIDETTNDIIWTDENGDTNAPTSGGNLSDPSITGFQSWLKGILNNIVNIFQPAHDAINTLAGAVSNFASWMYALYVWLPSPILSLLTSAISLAIVIGIIKVFI